jgi:nucleotide-binding universal stress UspA family protein
MKLLEKILIATDFSSSCDNVVDNAIRLAKTFQSKIIPIHVLPDDIRNEKALLLLNQAAEKELVAINARINKEGIGTDIPIVEYGNHYEKIILAADRINANLILIGAGEKVQNDVFQLGTTAEKIIRKSDKPVWVVKNDSQLTIKKILCPVDFSSESKRALINAIIVARRFNAELVIFSVYELIYADSLRLKIDWDAELEYVRMEHSKEFDTFLSQFNLADVNWKKEIHSGLPADEILKAISDKNIDLLIMGTTGKSGLTRILMGSVTEKVIREMPCSFITLKTEDFIDLKLESRIRDIETHYAIAKQLMKDGFFKESINEYKICLSINDMHIPSLYGIAKVYSKLQKPKSEAKYKDMAKEVMQRIWDQEIEIEIRKLNKFQPV